MDSSKEYIKMCEKSEEIQGLRKEKRTVPFWGERLCDNPQNGDYYGDSEGETYLIAGTFGIAGYIIWLPRQDQLQEMINESWENVLYEFYQFISDDDCGRTYYSEDKVNKYESMEQLWLAFVMKEKYSKVWNGKEWKKEGV